MIPFCLYIFRWMVEAGLPELSENTFAALPVGAINTTFCPNFIIVRTKAPAKEVFPVPAQPRRIMRVCFSRSNIKRENVCSAFSCSVVGTKPK